MTSYYECHITIEGDPSKKSAISSQKAEAEYVTKALSWKFSAIDGDPVTGPGIKWYATRHFNIRLGDDEVTSILLKIATKMTSMGLNVTRRKVERVLYDDRSSKVKPCDGGCIECHLDDYVKEL